MTQKTEPKTKVRLRNALNELMESQHFTEITVNDICEHAYVGRSTFYEHFQDKYDLLVYTLNAVAETFEQNTKNEPLITKLKILLSGVQEQSTFFKRLQGSDLNHELTQILRRVWRDTIEAKFQDESDLDDFSIWFASGGFIHSIIRWIEMDFDMSANELAENFIAVFNKLKKRASD